MGDELPFEPLSSDELRLLTVFGFGGVGHIVVGGYAMRVHGLLRAVEDLDLVIDTSKDNLDRLEQALVHLRVSNASDVRSHFQTKPNARWDWREGNHDYDVDLLARVHTFRLPELAADAKVVMVGSLRLPVISRAKLIEVKRATAGDPERREKAAQDQKDLEFLLRDAVEQALEADGASRRRPR